MFKISRIFCVGTVPASKVMVMGMAARIHKLPSSRAGKNSEPNRLPKMAQTNKKTAPMPTMKRRFLSDQCRAGV